MPRGKGRNKLRLVTAPKRTPAEAQYLADVVEDIDAADKGSELIGYVAMAFYQDGSTNLHSWRPNAEQHKVGNTMFEAWARASLERQLTYAIGKAAADDVIDERYIPPED